LFVVELWVDMQWCKDGGTGHGWSCELVAVLRILWMVEGDLAMKAQIDGDGRNSSACCTLKISSSLALLCLQMPCSGS